MRAYIKNESVVFDYPEDMEKILRYLKANGTLNIQPSTVERLYYDFSDTHACGWCIVDEERLEEFADYLSEVEL